MGTKNYQGLIKLDMVPLKCKAVFLLYPAVDDIPGKHKHCRVVSTAQAAAWFLLSCGHGHGRQPAAGEPW